MIEAPITMITFSLNMSLFLLIKMQFLFVNLENVLYF